MRIRADPDPQHWIYEPTIKLWMQKHDACQLVKTCSWAVGSFLSFGLSLDKKVGLGKAQTFITYFNFIFLIVILSRFPPSRAQTGPS